MESSIKNSPVVFAVGTDYKIFVPVKDCTLMWVKVGDKCYFDHSNGVLRSAVTVHKMSIPMEELDREGRYTVCYRRVIERKPYFSETSEVYEESFDFYPMPCDNYNIYHISDAHGMVNQPAAGAKHFEEKYGRIDLLILNGDIFEHSGSIENFDAVYEIASLITGGKIPVVFSRGNHDTRGIYAEVIADYTPTRGGYSYFSFRIGSLWGLVVDCGEDKPDTNAEYGNTICCHEFRMEQTRYIESIIENAENEYAAQGVKRKIVIAHSPFTKTFTPPFNIEEDTYAYWTKLLREHIKPELMICGHTHVLNVSLPGDEQDAYGQGCPVIVAATPNQKEKTFIGGGFVFSGDETKLVFANQDGIISEQKI